MTNDVGDFMAEGRRLSLREEFDRLEAQAIRQLVLGSAERQSDAYAMLRGHSLTCQWFNDAFPGYPVRVDVWKKTKLRLSNFTAFDLNAKAWQGLAEALDNCPGERVAVIVPVFDLRELAVIHTHEGLPLLDNSFRLSAQSGDVTLFLETLRGFAAAIRETSPL